MSADTETLSPGRPRSELLRRRAIRHGWLAVLAGVIFPVVALWGAGTGWHLRHTDHRQGIALIVAGLLVFTVRLVLWVSG